MTVHPSGLLTSDTRARFMAKVEKTDTCWLWTAGAAGRNGAYGKFCVSGQSVFAHRAAYELLVGPIPEGLTLDHLCRNTKCVNPEHLEPVTLAENIRRRWRAEPQDHCRNGHSYADGNRFVDSKGCRSCRACAREANARWRAANPRQRIAA